MYPCISCTKEISNRQHAIQCDKCDRWQHRTCGTGITQQQYRLMVKGELQLEWVCADCRERIVDVPDHINSTAVGGIPPFNLTAVASPIRSLSETFVVRSTEAEEDMDTAGPVEGRRIEDRSFNITHREVVRPPTVQDISLPDRVIGPDIPEDSPVTYEVIEAGSKRGGRKLVSSDGYTYTVRRVNGDRTYWTCSVRGATSKCFASVKQYKDLFTASINTHNHPADPGASKKVKISAKVKEVARNHVFKPAALIVEEIMNEMTGPTDTCLPKPDNLSRAANLHRQSLRPKDPTTLDFEINREFIGEEFVLDDILVDSARHITFGTQDQLQLLRQARRWYIDGTFKLVKSPFYQLLTVHTFVKKGDHTKQVPLFYCLMSRRSKKDYVEVLNSLKSRLEHPLVEWFMVDFEAAIWQAIREVFPSSIIKGCVFHWSQRIYRRIMTEGLSTAYTARGDVHDFLRKVLSLPYLPSEHIQRAFAHLHQQAEEVGGSLLRVVEYVSRVWIHGTTWRVDNWSVFRETVRTNNDVEGWHRRINTRAGRADLGFYVLVPLLRGESRTVDLQIRLVSEHLLTRINRKRYASTHGRLFDLWDQYEDDEMTTTNLLRQCSRIIGLGPVAGNDGVHDGEEDQ